MSQVPQETKVPGPSRRRWQRTLAYTAGGATKGSRESPGQGRDGGLVGGVTRLLLGCNCMATTSPENEKTDAHDSPTQMLQIRMVTVREMLHMSSFRMLAARHKSEQRRVLTAVGLSIAFLVLPACASGQDVRPAEKVTPRPLNLALVVDPAWAQVSVADTMGLFRKAGIEVNVTKFASGAAAMAALNGGAVDIATAGDVPTAGAIIANPAVRILAQGAYHANMRVLASREKITTAADLRGRKIGTAFGTSAHYMVTELLQQAGVEAELVAISPPDIRTALERGNIDAAAIFEPYATQIEEYLGDKAVTLTSAPPYTSLVFYNTTSEVLTRRSDDLSRLLDALACASKLLMQENPQALDAVGNATSLKGNTLRSVVKGYTYELSLTDEAGDKLRTLAEWAVREGNIGPNSRIPDYSASFARGQLATPLVPDSQTCS